MVESKEPAAVMNIEDVVPADPKQPYDVRNVIKCIVDDPTSWKYRSCGQPTL